MIIEWNTPISYDGSCRCIGCCSSMHYSYNANTFHMMGVASVLGVALPCTTHIMQIHSVLYFIIFHPCPNYIHFLSVSLRKETSFLVYMFLFPVYTYIESLKIRSTGSTKLELNLSVGFPKNSFMNKMFHQQLASE